jgi:hypothetical protein
MFRRFSGACSPAVRLTAASTTCAAPLAMMRMASGGQSQQQRGGNNRGNNSNNANKKVGVFQPGFDIAKPASSKSDGYKLRVLHVGNNVIVNFFAQVRDLEEAGKPDSVKEALFSQTKVSTFLPTVYIARFIGVLEGSIDKCVLNSRLTKGTFEAVAGKQHTFSLKCTSTAAQSDAATEWAVELNAGDAVLFHRFLVKSLDANHGFSATTVLGK